MKHSKLKIIKCIIPLLAMSLVGCKHEEVVQQQESPKDIIEQKVDKMTIDEKIGQMILAGFEGTQINQYTNTLINDFKIGGVILFKRNIESSQQLKKLTTDINKLNNNTPLFISVDEEGGRVSRLPGNVLKFPKASVVGQTNDEKYAYENGEKLGNILSEHGINMDHAPVLDIYSNPKNTVIGDRAFGTDENIVSKMGIATMKGLEDSNVIPTVKHFPGHGDTEVDSHFGLPIVNKSLEQLKNFEFIPFKKAIENNCDVIMVSHIILDKIDNTNPSSLSKKIITDVLRGDLGFNKVVVTDDMNMAAITNNRSVEKASIESIKAGSDIILIGSGFETVKSVTEEIKLAIDSNEISEERINESVYRILKLKGKYKILKTDASDLYS